MTFSGLAAFAVAAAFGGGLAWLIARARRLEKQAEFDRAVRARKLGWRYEGALREPRVDYRFAGGRDGIRWTMWYDSDRGDKSPTPRAHWLCENLRTDRLSLVILGRRRLDFESGTAGRLLIGVVTGIASAVGGRDGIADKADFYEGCVRLDRTGREFGTRFAAAVAADMPRAWLDGEVERMFTRWPASPGGRGFAADEAIEVNLGPRGLSITVQRMPADMAQWQHLAELGEALALRLAAARN